MLGIFSLKQRPRASILLFFTLLSLDLTTANPVHKIYQLILNKFILFNFFFKLSQLAVPLLCLNIVDSVAPLIRMPFHKQSLSEIDSINGLAQNYGFGHSLVLRH